VSKGDKDKDEPQPVAIQARPAEMKVKGNKDG
jgi:hypothetical protein